MDEPWVTVGERRPPDPVALVLALELETLSPACRADPARLDAFLADDFHEFGRSGGELTKDGTAERVAAATTGGDDAVEVLDLRGQRLADDLVLVKYTSVAGPRRTHRTSLWRRHPAHGWQMLHHQGTPTG
ncbi:DUF4440 domain-containing protein [Arthrobacter sp. NEB 688]|uniref:nuclear transport factor 2 family protein n=1 Tax=Arthrobacter sp. NEB 688 TaxID=904039 RepID=UPI0015639725|nr:DUF4440 domain-containing protein [Arthrobacter sp. NEB 688]QKE84747.1 DUF4440 domain-containing protein [Arthrobacter sp. NEB 688]